MASFITATPQNPNAVPFNIPITEFGENHTVMTQAASQTWFKIIKCKKSQYSTKATFGAIMKLAQIHWEWLNRTHPNECYVNNYCIVSCLFVPNENGGHFFLATIPRSQMQNDIIRVGRTRAPIWYQAAQNNGIIGGGTGGVHAEDAAEWLFEVSQIWNGRAPTADGHYLPPGAGQIRLASWGKSKTSKNPAGVIRPCPCHPFEATRKEPPCVIVAENLGINVWNRSKVPTEADEAREDAKSNGPGAGQGGPGIGGQMDSLAKQMAGTKL
jgi:hypothetical protein